MRRAVGIVIHNWPLKVAAILLATLLYAGLVLSQNAQIWRGHVAIIPLRQPADAVLLGTLPDVTSIRYFAPTDVAGRLNPSSFTATVDLSGATVTPESPFVQAKVDVRAADPRVQILDFEPQAIRVQLDPLISKTVPIEVDRGPVPSGLEVRDPVLSADSVAVSGPESVVRLVTAALARVVIQPSGIDVDQMVDLIAVDASGNMQTPVDLEPSSVRVQIRVGSQLQTKTLPVNPVVVGTPAPGYEVASFAAAPVVATIEGEADALASLVRIDTVPVSVSGTTSDVVATTQLQLPSGTSAVGDPTVQVTVHLRATTGTRTIQAGVTLAGARDDRTYTTSADTVSVTVGGKTADLNDLSGASVTAVADVGGLEPGLHSVPLSVSLPSGLTVVAIAPASVRIVVGEPATPPPTVPPPTAPPVLPSGVP
jgi:YbbR domain-containing protein